MLWIPGTFYRKIRGICILSNKNKFSHSFHIRVNHQPQGSVAGYTMYLIINQTVLYLKLIIFQEGDVIELCQVSDIRAGGLPKDMKTLSQLTNKHGPDLEAKSLTICSGTDYININYQHIVCPDAETAKVCLQWFLEYDETVNISS